MTCMNTHVDIILIFGIVRILKFNVATIMEKPDYIFIIEVFGREYVIHSGEK